MIRITVLIQLFSLWDFHSHFEITCFYTFITGRSVHSTGASDNGPPPQFFGASLRGQNIQGPRRTRQSCTGFDTVYPRRNQWYYRMCTCATRLTMQKSIVVDDQHVSADRCIADHIASANINDKLKCPFASQPRQGRHIASLRSTNYFRPFLGATIGFSSYYRLCSYSAPKDGWLDWRPFAPTLQERRERVPKSCGVTCFFRFRRMITKQPSMNGPAFNRIWERDSLFKTFANHFHSI